jgi:hypothetical protein
MVHDAKVKTRYDARKSLIYRMFQKEPYNCSPNVTVWLVSRKRLHLKAYKLSIFQGVEHLERHGKALFEAPCITSRIHIKP